MLWGGATAAAPPYEWPEDTVTTARLQQQHVQVAVSNALTRVAGAAASAAGALAGLLWFHLHTASKAAMACMVLFGWLLLLLSELRVLQQTTLLILLYAAAFSLPLGYVEFRPVVEHALAEVQGSCGHVVARQSKLSTGAAAGAFAAVMGGLHWSLTLRMTAATAAAAAVLYFWYTNDKLVTSNPPPAVEASPQQQQQPLLQPLQQPQSEQVLE